jgi:presequence protease
MTSSARGVLVLSSKALVRNHAATVRAGARDLRRGAFRRTERIRELLSQHARAPRPERHRQRPWPCDAGGRLGMMSPTASAVVTSSSGLAKASAALKALDEAWTTMGSSSSFARQLQAQLHQAVRCAPRQFLLVTDEDHHGRPAMDAWNASGWRDTPAAAPRCLWHCNRCAPACNRPGITSTQVNFCAKAYPTVPMGHPDAPR